MTKFNSIKSTILLVVISSLSIFSLSANIAYSQDDHQVDNHDTHHYPSHIVGGFLGGTSGGGETTLTFGAEYELRTSEYFGVGTAIERVSGQAVLGFLLVHIHPLENLRLSAGVGKEWVDSHTELDHGVPHTVPSHSETAYRISIAYDIEITDGYAIAPTYNLDFINGHEVSVFGLVFLKHF